MKTKVKPKQYARVPDIDKDRKPMEVLTWLALCSFAQWQTDGKGHLVKSKADSCIPSIEKLAEKAHINERTLQRALKELIKAGYVTVDERRTKPRKPGSKGKQTSNSYTLYALGDAPRPKEPEKVISPEEQARTRYLVTEYCKDFRTKGADYALARQKEIRAAFENGATPETLTATSQGPLENP